MTCHIAGDSIAYGLGQLMTGCTLDAKVGIPSHDVIGRVQNADLLIVSAGSNDPDNPSLAANLRAIRAKASGRVLWVVPQNARAARLVQDIATKLNDPVVHFIAGPDGIHPKSYISLMRRVRTAAGI